MLSMVWINSSCTTHFISSPANSLWSETPRSEMLKVTEELRKVMCKVVRGLGNEVVQCCFYFTFRSASIQSAISLFQYILNGQNHIHIIFAYSMSSFTWINVNNREQKSVEFFHFMLTLKEEEVILFKENVAVGGNSKLSCGFSSLSDFFIFWQSKQAVWHEVRLETLSTRVNPIETSKGFFCSVIFFCIVVTGKWRLPFL